tara:strand:- start:91 stop:297 length:207 start_codon:yes stop_codon:yes gene_type:complete
MLTIALTVAVSALLVDRIIEPAQAQDCPSSWEIGRLVDDAADKVINRVLFCVDGSTVNGNSLSTYCNS